MSPRDINRPKRRHNLNVRRNPLPFLRSFYHIITHPARFAQPTLRYTRMSIGTVYPPEWRRTRDTDTGRELRQYTASKSHSYPLYYVNDSITDDERYLVFHSERTGYVQLYRLDLVTGEIVQLTDGHTRRSGWALWCEAELRGIYNHLSTFNPVAREVYYFQDHEIRATHIDTLDNRVLADMPDRISIGQTSVSPDGQWFAFIHTDRIRYHAHVADKLALGKMNQSHRWPYDQWRKDVPTTISLINVTTGEMRDVIELDYHIHHVNFINADTLLLIHPEHTRGMWTLKTDGTESQLIRPKNQHGAAQHPVVTKSGVYYDSFVNTGKTMKRRQNWFGRYDYATDRYKEVRLSVPGQIHTGRDPDGRFYVFEHLWKKHELITFHYPANPEKAVIKRLRTLAPISRTAGQRFHAHPFLSPNRQWLFFTEMVKDYAQILALNVGHLTNHKDSWFN